MGREKQFRPVGGRANWSHHANQHGRFFNGLEKDLSNDLVIFLPKDSAWIRLQRTCSSMFTVALLTQASKGKDPRCPLMTVWFTYT